MTAFTYTGVPTAAHDGDTATFLLTAAAVDIGFGVNVTGTSTQICRFLGYNSRELAMPGGPEARDFLAQLLAGPGPLRVVSVKYDKYGGRFDGLAYLPDGSSVADLMIAAGYALAWDGKGVKPVPAWPLVIPG